MPASYSNWQEKYIPEPNSGCWIWLGAVSKWGYGVVYPCGRIGKQHRAHRLMYELHYGPIPKRLFVCHHCDNGLCVNPNHLFVGTHKDNMQDMVRKKRQCRTNRPAARLTIEQVLAIRASTENRAILAKRYSVGENHISKIRSGRVWRASI